MYQTATPRIYDVKPQPKSDSPSDWVVRTMDDEKIFGVELYRKSYIEAVNNDWLSDYRIIALGINDPDSYALVNQLAQNTQSKGAAQTHRIRLPARPCVHSRYGWGNVHQRQRRQGNCGPDPVLHRLHEHRRQVKEHGARLATPGGQELATGLDA